MTWFLETNRMKLREISCQDEDHLLDLDSDPLVMRFLTNGKATSREDIRLFAKRTETLFKEHQGKYGFWAAIEKSTGEFMGWFHFRPGKGAPENTKRIELG